MLLATAPGVTLAAYSGRGHLKGAHEGLNLECCLFHFSLLAGFQLLPRSQPLTNALVLGW